jgi:hypothetical protein
LSEASADLPASGRFIRSWILKNWGMTNIKEEFSEMGFRQGIIMYSSDAEF